MGGSAGGSLGGAGAATALGMDPVTGAVLGSGQAQGLASGLGGALSNGFKSVTGPNGGGPEMANIQQGTSVQDVQNAQNQAGSSLQSQQALLKALQGQNGLMQQNTAGSMQMGLANQLAAANGVGTQQGAISGLQNTAGMYQNIANGQGPNPAQAMLNQATGQNVANQAALMAGQRGAGANVGLMARQAGQQGAATQQQAAGQGATMQANQQLNALSGLTGAQQAIGGMGSNLVNQQAGANQAYANHANNIAGQQIAATGANTNAQLQNQSQMQNALQGVNNANVGAQGSVNSGNVGLSQTHTGALGNIVGGIMQGGGAAAGMGARGGMVHMDQGGMTPMAQPNMSVAPPVGAQSSFGQFMNGATASNNEAASEKFVEPEAAEKPAFSGGKLEQGTASMTSGLGKKAKSFGAEAAAARGGLAKGGGNVKATSESQKAEASGNSYQNDKIPAMLSQSEIVLPRSVTLSSDPVSASAKFVAEVLKRRGKK